MDGIKILDSYGNVKTLRGQTLNNLLDELSTSNFNSADLFLMPPDDSEGDSDTSDTENVDAGSGNMADKFSSKVLANSAEATVNFEPNDEVVLSPDSMSASTSSPDNPSVKPPARKKAKVTVKWQSRQKVIK